MLLAVPAVQPYTVPIVVLAIIALEIWQWLDAHGWAGRIIDALWLEVRWLSATAVAIGVLILADLSKSGFLYFKF